MDKSECTVIGLSGAGQEFRKPFAERYLVLYHVGMWLVLPPK